MKPLNYCLAAYAAKSASLESGEAILLQYGQYLFAPSDFQHQEALIGC